MWRKVVALLGLTLLLGACGDASDYKDGESTGGTADTGVASLDLLVSSSQLPSDGSDPVTVTALAKDSSNTVVEGEKISFSSDSGALQVTQGTTDASGQAVAELTPGGDVSVRDITVTAESGTAKESISVEVSGTTLNLDGPSSLVLGYTGEWTATLKDSGGQGVSGETIDVSSEMGNVLGSSTVTTNSSGQVSFTMEATSGSGTDTLTATGLGITAQDTVEISGQNFRFTEPNADAELKISQETAVTIRWENDGSAVTSTPVDFATTRGNFVFNNDATVTKETDSNGYATVNLTASDVGPATITATGPDGSPSANRSIEFISTNAADITVQADPSTIAPNETSEITAVVTDANGNLVKNKTVEFHLYDNTGGELNSAEATTDSQGRATTTYEASSTTSEKNGITVEARVKEDDSIVDETTLTVSGQALNIKLGTGGTVKAPNAQDYVKTWTILVTDSNGNPVEGAEVNLSLKPETYRKGAWVRTDTDNDGTADQWAIWHDSTFDGNYDKSGAFSCPREDENLDGSIDPGEDADSDGILEPDGAAAVTPDLVTTDEDGFAKVDVVYPQSEAWWSVQTLEATAKVAGSQGFSSATFLLWILADEVDDIDNDPPGGSGSGPYGYMGDCTVDNVNGS